MTSEEYGRRFFEQVAAFEFLDVYTLGVKPKTIRRQEPEDLLLYTYLAVNQNATGQWEVLALNAGANYLNTAAINGDVVTQSNIPHDDLAQVTIDFLNFNEVVFASSYFALDYLGQRYIAFPVFALDTSYITGDKPLELGRKLASSQIHVSIFKSSDGARLDDAFQRVTTIKSREMVFFMEKDDGTNKFGSVFRIKAGKGLDPRSIFPYDIFLTVLKDYGINTTRQQLKQQVEKALRDRSTEFSLLPTAVNGLIEDIIVAPTTTILDGVATILEAASSWTGEQMLGINYWNRIIDGKRNEEYDPLLPHMDLADKDHVKKTINLVMVRTANSLVTPLAERLDEALYSAGKLPTVGAVVVGRLKPLSTVVQSIPDLLIGMVDVMVDALAAGLEFLNAFIVGLLNTIIELVKFILDVLAMLFRYMSTMTRGTSSFRQSPLVFFSFFFESLENIIEAFVNLFSKENFAALFVFYAALPGKISEVLPLLWGNLVRSAGEVYAHDLGYYLGYLVGWLAQEIAGVLLTGGAANLSKAVKVYFTGYKTLFKDMAKATTSGARATGQIARGAATMFLDGVQYLGYYAQRVPELITELNKWLDDLVRVLMANADVLLAKYKAAVQLLNELGVTITRNLDQNLFPELVARGLEGEIYVIRNKVPIFSGTDEAFEAFAKQIDQINADAGGGRKGHNAVEEHLDKVEFKDLDVELDLKGRKVRLPGFYFEQINYTKKVRSKYYQERNVFKNRVKKDFLKYLVTNDKSLDLLKKSGIESSIIDFMIQNKGKLPKNSGLQVHHRLPLDDNGDNQFSNLILIKNNPYHKALTNYQIRRTKGMKVDESKLLQWPNYNFEIYIP
ncbi:MAG: hypothetical protein WBA16_07580 [Nonlabens sp.]